MLDIILMCFGHCQEVKLDSSFCGSVAGGQELIFFE
jgi:hypothetical protein